MTYSTYVVFVMQAPRVDLCELSLQSVSGTPAILGPAYDAPCELAASLYVNDSKRDIVEAALLRAKEARDDETVRLMHWERSEERRVGKECRSEEWQDECKE